ncbi:VOC family protein [Fontibacter flavus]|uniref:VOC family protein n=1 Tax=Fontibacter flavus TaxID=654838 RepID=A0ABV6FVG3_9BACT
MNNHVTVSWFEIPVNDMESAIAFYEKVFDCKLERHQLGPIDMAWFPWNHEMGGAGGSLVKSEGNYQTSENGVLVYFSSEDVNQELERIPKAGGQVLQGKTLITIEIGYMALFIDSEGNRIALHSLK